MTGAAEIVFKVWLVAVVVELSGDGSAAASESPGDSSDSTPSFLSPAFEPLLVFVVSWGAIVIVAAKRDGRTDPTSRASKVGWEALTGFTPLVICSRLFGSISAQG